ncbi:ATP-binding cassette domain-containing protein [Defluviimonas salinarum]|uniref:ATP-binding cassette domain-containing protein n=1 Tax=Defluviimonas salinarum TaxID=2992147 RepID=A0ABT3J802_9RHOB|nr:ATP-binding cassette domain-containing protein [Defluviimonas salinarum]MCW3783780.1 ATP-binding cassette domain-containing protein [Defluviimonas salinarum]
MVSPILPLTLENVELRRQGKRVLGPVSYTLDGEGITIVMGPNGAGKTSFLRCMHGLERLSRGRMQWQGDEDRIRARQAFVFQTPILMRRSVLDCIAYPLILDGLSRREARKAAEREAEIVGLKVTLNAPANVLSGGERQKLALARALIRAPEVLFLDEPCANLDLHSTAEIERVLAGARDRGTRIVMSTHNVGQARRLADDILFLSDGRLIETGSRDVFFAGPGTPEARAHINGDLLP